MPAPRTRRPARLLLLALIVIGLATLAALAITSLVSQPSDVAYANDDYQVPPPDTNPPPLPQPQTYEEAEQWVNENAFYAQTAPLPVRCNSQPINVTSASDEQLKSHFEGLMECLVRVWQPPITNAGFIIVRPTVTIYGEEVTTKCGTTGVNAFYCPADQQIYYSNLLPQTIESVAENKWTADIIMAHEYAHLLQGRTGIAISAHALGQRSGDEATNFAYIRRLETQADCFSGMFIRSTSVSLGRAAAGPGRHRGHLRRHRRRHPLRRSAGGGQPRSRPLADGTGQQGLWTSAVMTATPSSPRRTSSGRGEPAAGGRAGSAPEARLRRCGEERRGNGGDALTPAGQAQPVGSGRRQ